MRILYLIWNVPSNSGVHKKICSQIRSWKESGQVVSALLVHRDESAARQLSDELKIEVAFVKYHSWKSSFLGLSQLMDQAQMLHPDIIYSRYVPYFPKVAKLFRQIPTVIEINSDDVSEALSQREELPWSNPRYLHTRLGRKKILSRVSGLIFVTQELAQSPNFRFEKPTCVISNGLELGPVVAADPTLRPAAVFLGSPNQVWHGTTKIEILAEKLPDIDFHIIGISRAGLQSKNLFFHGHLDVEAYESILQKSTVGIGTLSLYEKRMQEACPLKVREYLANGLPAIIGYWDTDFSGHNLDFILQLPNTPENVAANIPQIESFIRKWQGRRVATDRVREFSIAEKEKHRIAFLQQFA